jgi:hypothetical protein
MKYTNINALALAIGIALSTGAIAESMSKEQYESLVTKIDTDYKIAKEICDSLAGNANDVCDAEAKGKLNVAKADAEYSVATEKCDDKDGNVKDVCIKEAKAAKTQQTAAAEAQMKTSKADAVAIEKSSDARKDAEKDMRDANYAVAKEKCDALASDSKDLCLNDAKVHFDR